MKNLKVFEVSLVGPTEITGQILRLLAVHPPDHAQTGKACHVSAVVDDDFGSRTYGFVPLHKESYGPHVREVLVSMSLFGVIGNVLVFVAEITP